MYETTFNTKTPEKYTMPLDGIICKVGVDFELLPGLARVTLAQAIFEAITICQDKFARGWEPCVEKECDSIAL